MEKCSSGKEGKKNPTILDGKYELGRLLGHGTFAKVYHARNLASGKSVAIKAVGKEKILKVGMMEQIKREIAVMKMVKHSNIVDLHEVMATKTKIYFAMEFVKGGELFAKVARGKLREDLARTYFQQLISAVDFCHSRGVYHRDLKLENLLLDEHGNLKETDFGLSALSDHIRPDVGLLHTTCGTPAYVAPEVLAKRGYDGAKADLWSCGVILYVLLAGFLPFQDNNVVAMYRKIYRGDFKCPPWFSSEARRLILKLLDRNPNTRITMDKLMEAPWFKKQSTLPPPPSKTVAFEAEDDLCRSGESLNAFHIISLSQGFDLSPLFEGKKKAREELRFTAKESASNVMSKLENLAKAAKFSVKRSETKVKMQGPLDNGRKGHLAISAEVFAVAPSFVVVEMKKSFGDTLDYHRFCTDDLRPALRDIVWAWQGESPTTAT